MAEAYIGVGANLGDRESTIAAALAALDEGPGVTVGRCSSLRETEPWGPVAQPDYLNAVVVIDTELAPFELLARLLEIERALGRDRADELRYGPRTIDLDLLLYGDQVIAEPGLEVPHPRISEREFVLEPLVELDPSLVIPGHGHADELLARLRGQ
ncbi:MAG: 2-amino-4-hydroxy-6-hydroxymethyldihydropteridine diphosphokinase [Gaiellales bacterium]